MAHCMWVYCTLCLCDQWLAALIDTHAPSAFWLYCPIRCYRLSTISPYLPISICAPVYAYDICWRPHGFACAYVPIWFSPASPYRWGSSAVNLVQFVVLLWLLLGNFRLLERKANKNQSIRKWRNVIWLKMSRAKADSIIKMWYFGTDKRY